MSVARKIKTNAELCAEADALPEPYVGEVIDGELYTMGRASPAHAEVETVLASRLKLGGGGPPASGWYTQTEVEVRFPNHEKCIPDLSGWKNERIGSHYNDNPIPIAPDWVCEILSDSTRRKDLGPKRKMYARQGVGHLWHIDPEKHTLEAFALNASKRWELVGAWSEDDEAEVPPFSGLVVRLTEWWLKQPV